MIQSYFESEKKAGFIALALGLVASSVACAFFISARPPFYTGMGVALLAVGIIEMVVGATLARRSDLQANDLQKMFAHSQVEFVQTELPRMEKIMQSFTRYKWIEIVMAATGLGLILVNDEPVFSKGLGAGLLLQSITMFSFDFFAEKRARTYLAFIRSHLS